MDVQWCNHCTTRQTSSRSSLFMWFAWTWNSKIITFLTFVLCLGISAKSVCFSFLIFSKNLFSSSAINLHNVHMNFVSDLDLWLQSHNHLTIVLAPRFFDSFTSVPEASRAHLDLWLHSHNHLTIVLAPRPDTKGIFFIFSSLSSHSLACTATFLKRMLFDFTIMDTKPAASSKSSHVLKKWKIERYFVFFFVFVHRNLTK